MTMKKVLLTIVVAIFATVVLGQTKTEVKVVNLPGCVTDWVKKSLKDYSIDKAYKFESKADNKVMITYHVRVVKAKELQWYSFGPDCQDVKKIPVTEAETVPIKPQPLPPIKQGGEIKKESTTPTTPKK